MSRKSGAIQGITTHLSNMGNGSLYRMLGRYNGSLGKNHRIPPGNPLAETLGHPSAYRQHRRPEIWPAILNYRSDTPPDDYPFAEIATRSCNICNNFSLDIG